MTLLPLASVVLILAQAPAAAAPGMSTAITARTVQPGEVLRVDIRPSAPFASATVRVFDQVIPAAPVTEDTWRALVGIDLNIAPGDYPIVIEGKAASGAAAAEHETLTVEAKEFPTRTLTVDPRFVTPPKSALARIEREARRLGAIFRSEGDGPSWPGPFVVPIEGAVVSGFGVRSVYNGEPRSPHGGADFASPAGTPVHAPGPGVIVLASDLYFTGGTVVVDHGGGLYSLFAHLSRTVVHQGARVERGALVGEVGATGRVTGPHLHWTVRLHTARVDPLSLVFATADSTDPTGPR
jgi:murein DD-endopeptidase MepM/ murein hydrolase activator NlpD